MKMQCSLMISNLAAKILKQKGPNVQNNQARTRSPI